MEGIGLPRYHLASIPRGRRGANTGAPHGKSEDPAGRQAMAPFAAVLSVLVPVPTRNRVGFLRDARISRIAARVAAARQEE